MIDIFHNDILRYEMLKDNTVLDILDRIVDSHSTSPEKGIPIGNLTSPYCANHYLAILDYEIDDRLRMRPWIRYRDDMLCLDIEMYFSNQTGRAFTCHHKNQENGYGWFVHSARRVAGPSRRFLHDVQREQGFLLE